VTRKESPDDRRQISLVLTAKGRSVQAASHRATQDRLAEEMAHLPEPSKRNVISAMEILSEVFDSNPKP
jgi:DNA-binding MarR family transcriptional regulator